MAQDEQNGNAVTVAIPATAPQPPSPSPTTPSPSSVQNGNAPTTAAAETTTVMATGSQPSLRRGETVEIYDNKKLNRGISRATDNVNLVSQARSELVLDSVESELFVETPVHTFTLPDLSAFPDDFRHFLEKDLIAVSTQTSLEQAQRLNWWSGFCQRLWPLSTSGDGNCLLHAASLGMWGFHDRLLTLRSALHDFLSQSPRREALWRRWRRQQASLNAQAGLVYSEVEWRREWNAIVSMASTVPRLRRLSVASDPNGEISGAIYESLEEIHVLALAHVLRRPIVVIADTVLKDMNGEALAPIPFGGIYLPLECSPSECHRSPLLLAYDGGHFSALVAMDTPPPSLSSAIPLADGNFELLPIQFSIDPGDRGEESREHMELAHSDCVGLLYEYLDVLRIDPQQVSGGAGSSPESENSKPNGLLGSIGKSVGQKLRLKLSRSNSQRQGVAGCGKVGAGGGVLCAALHTDRRHEYHDAMVSNYIQSARTRFNLQQSAVAETVTSGAPRYGAGNSQFYAEADPASHERVSNLTPVKAAQNQDTTMYLCKSTFYKASQLCRTHECTFFGNPQTQNYCSKCYRQLVEEQCKAEPNSFGDENGNEGSITPLLVDTTTTLSADEAGPSLSKRPREPSEEVDTDLIYFIDDPGTAFDFVLEEENSGTVIPTAQKHDEAVVCDKCSTN